MSNKYVAGMVLHSLGDILGGRYRQWNLNNKDGYELTLAKVYEFISLGGATDIKISGWKASDVTIMHLAMAKSLLEYNDDSMNTLGKIFVSKFLEVLEKNGELLGGTTLKALNRLNMGGDWNNMAYDVRAGGAGATMRSLCIGMVFRGEANRHKLIQIAIESARITNNSAVGYLGSVVGALFASLACEGIEIKKWAMILLDLFERGVILKYIKMSGRGEEEYLRDSPIFIEKWHRYIDDKFDSAGNVLGRKLDKNLVYRGKYYNEAFGFRSNNGDGLDKNTRMFKGGKGNVRVFGRVDTRGQETKKDDIKKDMDEAGYIGSGGDDSVIIAYDCLIDCDGVWEKLVYYSMLHMGDGNTTGAIAGGWYGLVYGIGDVRSDMIEDLEYGKELEKVGNELYKKIEI
jgi:ADP-ribosylarginine hydrolase